MKKRIAVICGGFSSEHVISMKSAKTVYNHLNKDLFEPKLVIIDNQGWRIQTEDKEIPINLKDFSYTDKSERHGFDAAFLIIHGTPGEDGRLQGYFDMIGLPYTGCNHLSSAITFNKWSCNTLLKQLGFKCADSVILRRNDEVNTTTIIQTCGLPCFVKPNDGGSSFGVTKVKSEAELVPAVAKAFEEGSEVIIEKQVSGTEITVGVLKYEGKIMALPVTEIIPEGEFFDFAAKYEGKSKEITPARLPEDIYKQVSDTAERIYKSLGLSGVVRIDMMVQGVTPYIIEINTTPGMSDASIVPQQAARAGIKLSDLFTSILHQALH
jgi:D-alanine-D-alanine ligase